MLPHSPAIVNPLEWNSAICTLQGAHILQSWEWGAVKSQFGWQANHLLWYNEGEQITLHANHFPENPSGKELVGAALVLQRKIQVGGFAHKMGVIYLPKGPLLDWNDARLRGRILNDLKEYAQKHSAIFIKIDPDLEVGFGIPGSAEAIEHAEAKQVIDELKATAWRFSDEQIQFRNTVLIDLGASEDALLGSMKQKTRYNVNLAKRKGVSVRNGTPDDLDTLIHMYAETSVRDGFVIRNEAYYRAVWNAFLFDRVQKRLDQPAAQALIAEVDDEPIAAVLIFRFAGKAWYLYGMSRASHRDMMPNYLLQWEAICWAKASGCKVYDLWGAPDDFSESDPLWGVYRFKEGLGGSVHRYLGAWDLPINGMLYKLYTKTLPGLLDIMRQRGKANTRQAIG
jgi:peptidoglycan pentaglycine glycine transferase (the first glycine)